jgi:hypothetical protein
MSLRNLETLNHYAVLKPKTRQSSESRVLSNFLVLMRERILLINIGVTECFIHKYCYILKGEVLAKTPNDVVQSVLSS